MENVKNRINRKVELTEELLEIQTEEVSDYADEIAGNENYADKLRTSLLLSVQQLTTMRMTKLMIKSIKRDIEHLTQNKQSEVIEVEGE